MSGQLAYTTQDYLSLHKNKFAGTSLYCPCNRGQLNATLMQGAKLQVTCTKEKRDTARVKYLAQNIDLGQSLKLDHMIWSQQATVPPKFCKSANEV